MTHYNKHKKHLHAQKQRGGSPPTEIALSSARSRQNEICFTRKPQRRSRLDYIGIRPDLLNKDRRFGVAENLKIGIWNVREISSKALELIKEKTEMKIEISLDNLHRRCV